MLDIDGGGVNPMFDMNAVREWLELLHGTSPGLIHICATDNWLGQAFDDTAKAAEYVAEQDKLGRQGIYCRITTLSQRPQGKKRGGDDLTLAVPGFGADIDIAGPGHRHDPNKHNGLDLPPDAATAMSIVTHAGLPTPTLWVHSGGGIYPFWLFHEPIIIDGPATLENTQQFAARLHDILARAAADLGWFYGGECRDLARVLRIPGTVNRKDGLSRPCHVVEPAGYEFYRAADFANVLSVLERDSWPAPKLAIPRQEARSIDASRADLSPGDDFEVRVGWDDHLLLGGAGWTPVSLKGHTIYWRHPNAQSGAKWSASTGRAADRDRLYVWSPETVFPANQPITKFHAYAILHHGGNHSAASSALRSQGYGGERTPTPRTDLRELVPPAGAAFTVGVQAPTAPATPTAPVASVVPKRTWYPQTDLGNAERMVDCCGEDFRYNSTKKSWMYWDVDQGVWRQDLRSMVDRAAQKITYNMLEEARGLDADEGKRLQKFAYSCQSDGKLNALVSRFGKQEGIGVEDTVFDVDSNLVTVANGTLDLRTFKLSPSNRRDMLTRRMPVTFDPTATSPKFDTFLSQVLPDPAVRQYVQRAVGYTLLGSADERAFFVVNGPSGTGKSQFLNILEGLFGDFGCTAPAGTLRLKPSESGPNNDLHELKGRRFVTTSETSETSVLNEELIKRLTGGDAQRTRDLYESFQYWTPQCTVWLATNFFPQLNIEDPAIWSRVKSIEFNTTFIGTSTRKATPGIGKKILNEEASGILNWALEGLRLFREHGLGEPEAIASSLSRRKHESDNVALFVENARDEGILVTSDVDVIGTAIMFNMYQEWSRRNGYKFIGAKRFVRRMEALGYTRRKRGTWFWEGFRIGSAGFTGTM